MARLRSFRPGATIDLLYEAGEFLCDEAASRVREDLGRDTDPRQEMARRRAATIARISSLAEARCLEVLSQARASLRSSPGGLDPAALLDPEFLQRLTHLTVERILVHPAAPPLHLSPAADDGLAEVLAAAPVVAVLFDYPLAIVHELYPLWTDAYVQHQAGGPPVTIAGVHVSWLDAGCRARRAIVYSEHCDAFHEAGLPAPIDLDAAMLLAQAATTHRTTSARLVEAGIPHLNPYTRGAALADDKWACYERWSSAGVATPPTCLLPADASPDQALGRLEPFVKSCPPGVAGWFVQPRHGTESAGVRFVPEGARACAEMVETWQRLAVSDDAIVRPQAGLLWLEGPDGPRAFDLRLHVCRYGDRHYAESGYLVCAPDTTPPISSVAGGARIRRLGHLGEAALVQQRPREPVGPLRWSAAARDRALGAACEAAAALGLDLAGIDVKLDLLDGHVQPIVLDANPRPAGLLHADLIAAGIPDRGAPEAGIGASLWRQLDEVIRSR